MDILDQFLDNILDTAIGDVLPRDPCEVAGAKVGAEYAEGVRKAEWEDVAEVAEADEQFLAQVVKRCVIAMYDRPLSDRQWTNWRKLADCGRGSTWLGAEAAIRLMAVAKLKKRGKAGKKITALNVEILASGERHRTECLNFLRSAAERLVFGAQLQARLFDRGIVVTESDIRQAIPDFSRTRLYNFAAVAVGMAPKSRT